MSNAFSGCDAPTVAWNELACELEARLRSKFPGAKVGPIKVLHNIEWDKESQQELLMMPDSDACLFGDIADFFAPELADILRKARTNPKTAWSILGPIIKSGVGIRLQGPKCLRHNTTCRLRTAKIHWAGAPCTDWSSAGGQLGSSGVTT
eukprot:4540208-Pyramimonas_sp.AAC.1